MTWLDDNGWWITNIEFQSSSWSKGTYLNVGVCFQWYPNDFFSFDIGYREAEFVEFESEEQFQAAAQEYTEIAKSKVLGVPLKTDTHIEV